MATRTVQVLLTADASGLLSTVNSVKTSLTQLWNTDTSKMAGGFTVTTAAAKEMGSTTSSAGKLITDAMGGATSAFTKTSDAAKVAAKEQADFDKAVTSVSRTLDSATGAVTANTRAWVANKIGPENLSALDAMGVSTRDYVSAVVGVPSAQEKMRAALAGSASELKTLDTNMSMVATAQGNFAVKSEAAGASSIVVSEELQRLGVAAKTASGDINQVGAGGASGLREVSTAVTETDSAFAKLKSNMSAQIGVGALMAQGVMGAFSAVTTAIRDTIAAGVSYQTTMYTVQAVTGANVTQMAALGVEARALGKDMSLPATSATDAATAMLELAKGGLSVAAAMTAARGTLALAAAAQIDAGSAAEIQVNALNAFNLSADKAGHVADVLANASNQASGDITDFGFAMTAVGATAHSFGIGIEDTNTVLGLFANAGVKGEEGGTLFKTMLVKLAAASGPAKAALETLGVTAYDAGGQFEGTAKLTQQLADAHGRLTTEAFNAATAVAFGTRGIKGAAILAGTTTDAYNTMSNAINKDGSAVELAAAKMQGLGGAFQNLENQVQDAQLAVFDKLAPGLTEMVNAFAGGVPAVINVALGAVATIGSKIGDLLSPIINGIKQLFASAATSDAVHILGTDLGALGVAAISVFGAVEPLTKLIGNAIGWFSDLPAPIQAATFALAAMALTHGPMSNLISGIASGLIGLVGQFTATAGAIEAAGGVMAFSMDAVGVAAKAMWTAIGGWVGVGIAAAVGLFALFTGGSNDATVAVTDLSDAVDANTGKLKENAQQVLANKLGTDGALSAYSDIGGKVGDYTAALAGNVTAQDAVHTKLLDVATAAVQGSQGWATFSQNGEVAGKTAQQTASDILAGGDATSYQTAQFTGLDTGLNAVITASRNYSTESGTLTTAQTAAALAIQAGGQAAGGATPAISGAAAATQSLTDAANADVDPTALMAESLKEMKTAADQADVAGNFLIQTLTLLKGGEVDTEMATRANAAAFRGIADAMATVAEKQTAVNTAIAKYGANSPQAAAATRDLAGANDSLFNAQEKAAESADTMAGRAYTLALKQGGLSAAVAAASAVMQQQRDQFIKSQSAADQESGAAAKLADKLGLIPKKVTTELTAQGFAAMSADVTKLQSALKAIDGYHYTIYGNEIVTRANNPIVGLGGNVVRAEGGIVYGPGTGTSDSIAAKLSTGEFVINAAQTTKYRGLLENINNATGGFAGGGIVGRFAGGGPVTTPDPPPAAPVTTAAATPTMIPDVATIAKAWADIAAAITAAWTTSILPTFDLLDARTLKIATEFGSLDINDTQPRWAEIATTINTAWAATINPTYAAIDAGTAAVGARWTLLAGTNAATWDQIGQKIWGTWAAAINPTYGQINVGTTGVATQTWGLLNGTVTPVWAAVGNTIRGTWAGTIGPTYGQINAGTGNVGSAWQNLANIAADTWGRIGRTIITTYSNQVVPAWNGVQGFATATGKFFGGIASGMNNADTTTTTDLGQITSAINGFFKMVDSKTAVPKLADGGIITQGTGPRTDDVTIRASKGEYVVNAAATARHKPELDAINYGGFADGGLVGDKIGNRVDNAVVGGVQRAFDTGVTRILATVAAAISGYTPGSVTGARGKFLDAIATKMGTQYVWGASGPDVFDCSGLMSWGLDQAGINVGRLTAEQFNAGYPHIPVGAVIPGDLVTFDTGRLPGQAGHIGAVIDVAKHLMMNTDGSGPAGIADYQNRDGGPLSYLDPIGGSYVARAAAPAGKPGDPPSKGWLADLLARIAAGGTGAPTGPPAGGTAGVEQWRTTVLKALAITGQPAGLANTVLHQMQTESSGLASSINLTDSNAQRGTPSKGLLQVIDPTFQSYALAPYNRDIWDPLSNIIAAIRYTIGAYGGVAAGMQGHAYATGGIVGSDGRKQDTVPAWLSPGEAVISQMPGAAKANKGYLDTAASWFGGNITYPGDTKGTPAGVGFGAPVVNVAPPVIELYLYGDSAALDGRIDVRVDGALSDVAVKINRGRVST